MVHLVRRFLGALWPAPPRRDDLEWVTSLLSPAEYRLFVRLPNHDQRHLIRVTRKLEALLTDTEHADDERWLAVSLLHDVGKYDAHLGPYGRAVATVCGRIAGEDMAHEWSEKRGFTRKVGLYLRHGELGAEMIRLAGGREEAAQWSEAHNRDEDRAGTGFPPEVIEALVEADG